MKPEVQSRLLLFVGIFPITAIAALGYLALPQFVAMYASFGAELRFSTRLLFASYRWFALLPLLVLLAWFVWPIQAHRGFVAAVLGIAGSVILFGFGCWAAYVPLYILGAIQSGS